MEPVPEKKKRGRPSVYRKYFGNEHYKTAMKLELKGKCDRSVTNELYIRQGLLLAQEICDVDQVFFKNGRARGNWVLEQLGRMYLQNGCGKEDCLDVCDSAVGLLEEGCTVRYVEEFIRCTRNQGKW